jgi:NitT/TauT family transport system substrate-binding protein
MTTLISFSRRQGCRAALAVLGTALMVTAASAQDVWRHGMVQAKSDAGFTLMVTKGGFDKKHGLDVKIQQFKGDTTALKALIAGELDSYEGSPGSPLLAVSHGADVKVIGCYWPKLTYGIYAKNSIKTPQDFKGKTFAISAPGSLPDLVARAVLDKVGVPIADVRFAQMGSDVDRIRALSAGVVDVATASTEFVPMAKKAGTFRLMYNGGKVIPQYIRLCTYTTSAVLAKRGEDAVKFLAAEMAALHYALTHRDAEIKISREVTKAKPGDQRAEYIFDQVKELGAVDWQMKIPQDNIEWMEGVLLKTGNLKSKVDVSKMIAPSYREKALAEVKQESK